ncbi:MAG TPA: carboxypeptidase regulatory-like domain-containing protein, partial [Blastocatellia bacterium]|nr:carboxypeptidase regulatory-like domain-containing protein [Blastocatellia bacterium]
MRNSLTRISRVALTILLLTVLSVAASAQFKAGIQGTVTDATGAVVSGAKITVINKETSRELTATSNETGFYRVTGLPPGNYKVLAERDGFKRRELENVIVGAETAQGLELILEAGQISETVTVTGEATSRLQTENANIDRGITTQEIRRLPQYGRDPYELLRLAPGIFGQGARAAGGGAVNLPNTTGPGGSSLSIFQVENVVPISANGQRVSANNFSIDGVSVNSLGWGGAAIVTPNQESVKEIRVTSTSYSAEDGRNSGAQVKVISQNGTNQYHGSALFKYNEPGLNSFNKWGGIGGSPTVDAPPVRVENKFRQFGGSIGGPVIIPRFGEGGKAYFSGKNKLFFFFSFEGLRERTNNTYNQYIETEQFQQAVRTLRPNTTTAKILAAAGAPRIVQLLTSDCSVFGTAATARCRAVNGGLDIGSLTNAVGQYVPSQIGGGFDGVPDIVFAQLRAPNRARGDQYNLRFDYNLNERHNFAFSTYRTKRNDFISDTAGRTRETADLRFAPLTGSAMVTWNYTISPRVLNEARGNFTRFFSDQVKDS